MKNYFYGCIVILLSLMTHQCALTNEVINKGTVDVETTDNIADENVNSNSNKTQSGNQNNPGESSQKNGKYCYGQSQKKFKPGSVLCLHKDPTENDDGKTYPHQCKEQRNGALKWELLSATPCASLK